MRAALVAVEPAHILHIGPRMRAADRDEVAAWGACTPDAALRHSLAHSKLAWCGMLDGEPVALLGATAPCIIAPRAEPWLLGTDRLGEAPVTVARMARQVVTRLHRHYPVLANWTDARHLRAHALLRWLGFTLGPPEPRGMDGALFRPFWRGLDAE